MDRIIASDGSVLTEGIENLVPSNKGIRIERKLLDGSVHVQTIGASRKELKLDAYVRVEESERINEIYFTGEPITVFYDDRMYTGTIISEPAWSITVKDEVLYRILASNLTIAVKTEVVV